MTHLTQKQAAEFQCPVARTFDAGKKPHCEGSSCILWRWAPMAANDPRFVKAVNAKQSELHAAAEAAAPEKKRRIEGFHNAAVAEVAKEPWTFMQMTDDDCGWCGLGGKP